MAIKGSDGIILIADSRESIQYKKARIIAYTDNCPKIFILKKYAFAISSDNISDGKTMIGKMVSDFDKANCNYTDPGDAISCFTVFINKFYPNYDSVLKKSNIFCVGYFNNRQIISVMADNLIGDTKYMWNGTDKVLYEINKNKLFNPPINSDCMKLSILGENVMRDVISRTKSQKTMGGRFSVLKIDSNNHCIFIQNDFSRNAYATECEMVKAYFKGRIKYNFINSTTDKRIFDSLLTDKLKKCN